MYAGIESIPTEWLEHREQIPNWSQVSDVGLSITHNITHRTSDLRGFRSTWAALFELVCLLEILERNALKGRCYQLDRFQSCCAGKGSPPGAAVPHDSRSTKHYGQRKFCGPAALGWV